MNQDLNSSKGGIYLITHIPSQMVYVGQTNNFKVRWLQHQESLNSGNHHNHRLQKIWNADGIKSFSFKVAQYLPSDLSALERQRWLARHELIYWNDFNQKSLALNIVKPEIVETEKAFEEFKKEERQSDNLINRSITKLLKDLKGQLHAAYIEQNEHNQTFQTLHAEYLALEKLIRRNSGWRGFFFGLTTATSLETLKAQLFLLKEELSRQDSFRKKAEENVQNLIEERRSLYSKYPRRRRKQEFANRLYSGIGISRTPRIR